MNINIAVVGGKLTKDVEIRSTSNGKSVASFTIQAFAGRKDAQGKWRAEFIDVVAWEDLTKDLVGACKGDSITVQGEILKDADEYNGQKRYKTYIRAKKLEVKHAESAQSQQQFTPQQTFNPQQFNPQAFNPQPNFTVTPQNSSDEIVIDSNDLPF